MLQNNGMPLRYKHYLLLPFLALVLIATWWAYAPGLHGGFLFDDLGSLPALGASGPVTQWATFWRYITSGTADPTGRPLAMLTFLLDARNWPADPFPFKRTNLILHLCNGVLLYALGTRLGKLLNIDAQRARCAACLTSVMWLLHPLLVSTTLYIVQREAMLVATCVICGLLLWLHGRQQLIEGRLKAGTLWSICGLGGFTLLGSLAKANGVLLPLYALLIEIIVLAPRRPVPTGTARRTHLILLAALAVIPTVVVLGYVFWTGLHGLWIGGPVGVRSWSTGQRLLTEPRVLIDYLKLLWLPRPFSTGLFNDQYIASTSWLHPATTPPAMLAVLGLTAGAWVQRRRYPALALAVLFYFAGQVLESSAIPLELYFEHRNYVPALLMFWPLGLWLTDTRQLRWVKVALMVVIPLTLAVMTHVRATVWGNVQTQALIWAHINPGSPRAQANAAEVMIQQGHAEEAAAKLESLLAAQPDQAQLAFNLINARCMSGAIDSADLEAARKAMRHTANTGSLFVRWFEQVLPMTMSGSCRGLTPSALLALIDAGSSNPNLQAAGQRQDRSYLRGLVALSQRHPYAALDHFVIALDFLPRPGMALRAAATFGQHGYPVQGLRLLDHYQEIPAQVGSMSLNMVTLHDWVLRRQNYWARELTQLRNELSLAAQGASMHTMPPMHSSATTH
ncbi:tetratricopeptide repeat protein [Rhodanobacter lindaniclasticus]|nr:tetratricopeptide repeat protein [Rhodanobacter lindaniclasticus]